MVKTRASKRILCLVLSLILITSTFVGFSLTSAAVTGSEIVAYARQYIGYPYVYGTHGPNSFDCSGFVNYVFGHFGIYIPASTYSLWGYESNYGTIVAYGNINNAKAGDLILWTSHVAIYTENGKCVEALNQKYGVTEAVPVNSHTNGTNYRVIRVYGVNDGNNPQGHLDGIEGTTCAVRVAGWCFDRDDPTQSLRVHVYIGGPAGSGAECHEINANVSRTDVDNVYHVGQWHGFDSTISTSRTGQQDVYIYAINIGSGYNVEIGHGTANISTGSEMTSGYARTIPDGDYVIASALGRYHLDIYGTERPAVEGRAIDICECSGQWTNIAEFDIWTLKYNSDGFYSIYQKGTNVSLDVPNASTANCAYLQTWNANNTPAQKFAISKLENGNYRIQAKCSGLSLDVPKIENAAAIYQSVWHGGTNQQWYFIPYKPSVSSSDKVASTIYNGHEYVLYKKLTTWNDARDWCKNQGGNLVTITSSGEQSAVETLMAKASNWIWLGATDEASEGTWKWVTGESFSYSKWAGGQPDNSGNEDYLHMYLDGKWNDIPDYDGRCEYFILEKTHNHTSDSGTITTQPTCTATGVKTFKCTACGETIKTETIPAIGHTPGEWETEIYPTSVYDGLEVVRCTVCNEVIEERVIPKLGGAVPASLYLDSKPSKQSYEANEVFDPAGAKLRVKYSDGTVRELTIDEVEVAGFDNTSSGWQKVAFTYTENGTTLTTWAFSVVVDKQVNALYVTHKPNKTEYIMGEPFEHEGMTVVATFSDGTKADVSHSIRTSGYDTSATGVRTMTVSYTYKGKTVTAQFSYIMRAKLKSIAITQKPTKLTSYKVGDSFSREGMIITAYFTDGTSKDVSNNIKTSGYSMKTVGKQIITVTYTYGTQTRSAQFSIIMKEK